MRMIRLFPVLCAVLLALSACGPAPEEHGGRILKISPGKKIATLDPALAADTASQYMVTAFYDTPLQYSYTQFDNYYVPDMW